ncbi:MAG: phenylalanine--tRNA ligase subunit alpha [Patescibacteria group bacterium]
MNELPMVDYEQYFKNLQTINSCLKLRDELSRSGEIQEIKNQLKTADPDTKRKLGGQLNQLKKALQAASDDRIQQIQKQQEIEEEVTFDPTFYSEEYKTARGKLHPITQVMNEIVTIFQKMGYDIADGPLIETQWHCFTALNMPDYHPARSMQDTFFLKDTDEQGENYVLRTHTSGVQIRYAENHKPPFKMISPGQVYRNENIDSTHDIMFHQIECLVVDKNISISHLKTVLEDLFSQIFDDDRLTIRFRPSYFPYTIPSLEYDISCPFCNQQGCRICKHTKWIEIGGSGLVHPDVIKNMGLDPKEWQGFAFGFGVDRIAQFKLNISGLGQFFNGSQKFLRGE